MIYIRECYNRKGIFTEKRVIYYKATDEFVYDYNFYKKEADIVFETIDNGFKVYMHGYLRLKCYLAENEK